MVGTIQPREYFPISRVIADPSDLTAYYVRGIVRNARTGATIDTVSLVSLGSGIWALSWQAPADTSGQGLFITITTIVYTDANYTVLSDNYGQEQDTFLVYDRMKWVAGMAQQISAIGMGPDINYEKIKKMVDAAVTKALDPIKTALSELSDEIEEIELPEADSIDLGPISAGLERLEEALEPLGNLKNTDLAEVTSIITDARDRIAALKLPEFKETDLSPVLEALDKKEAPEIDHEKIAKGLLPALTDHLKEIVTPEFMDSFIKSGMNSKILSEIAGKSKKEVEPKKAIQYEKRGGKYLPKQ